MHGAKVKKYGHRSGEHCRAMKQSIHSRNKIFHLRAQQ